MLTRFILLPPAEIRGENSSNEEIQATCTFQKLEPINLPEAIGTITLPQRQIIGSSYNVADFLRTYDWFDTVLMGRKTYESP